MPKPEIELSELHKGNLDWLIGRTVFLTLHGSMAYGTNTPTSDIDLKGVCVPPKKYRNGFLNKFEQAELSKPYDGVIYDIRKFFHLAADCNPSVIEVLFTDPSDHYISSNFMKVLKNKDKFLSKKAKHTFSGYAHSQLKRIHTHRAWLLNPVDIPPERKDFGLPEHTKLSEEHLKAAEAVIRKKAESWDIDFNMISDSERIKVLNKIASSLAEIQIYSESDRWDIAGKSLGFEDNFLEYLKQERLYQTKLREFHQYQEWKTTRNPVRFELEEKFQYDCKHAMHLVRLIRMCGEILSGKGVIVKRPDAEELLSIRNGAWKFDDLLQWSKDQEEYLTKLANESILPNAPDRVFLDELLIDFIEDFEQY